MRRRRPACPSALARSTSRAVVEVPRGRRIERVKADRVSVADVGAARRELGKKPPKKKDGPRAAAVEKALGRRKSLGAIAVVIGEEHATFTRVPLDQLGTLGAALAKLELPKAES